MPPQKIKAGYIDANGSTTNQSLVSNGTFVSWANTTQNLTVRYANDAIAFSGMGTGTAYVANAAGSNTQVQFNGSGAFTGSAGFTFNTSTNNVFIANSLGVGTSSPAFALEIMSSYNNGLHIKDSTNTVFGGMFVESGTMSIVARSNNGIRFATSDTSRFTVNSTSVSPAASNTYDLGTTSLRWKTVYTNDLELSNGIGDYTIVEGEDDLFIYNNKKGKVYKFALIEVDPLEAPPKAK